MAERIHVIRDPLLDLGESPDVVLFALGTLLVENAYAPEGVHERAIVLRRQLMKSLLYQLGQIDPELELVLLDERATTPPQEDVPLGLGNEPKRVECQHLRARDDPALLKLHLESLQGLEQYRAMRRIVNTDSLILYSFARMWCYEAEFTGTKHIISLAQKINAYLR